MPAWTHFAARVSCHYFSQRFTAHACLCVRANRTARSRVCIQDGSHKGFLTSASSNPGASGRNAAFVTDRESQTAHKHNLLSQKGENERSYSSQRKQGREQRLAVVREEGLISRSWCIPLMLVKVAKGKHVVQRQTWWNLPDSTLTTTLNTSLFPSYEATWQKQSSASFPPDQHSFSQPDKCCIQGVNGGALTRHQLWNFSASVSGFIFGQKSRKNVYLSHKDERRSAVILPHGSSSSQPEVKVRPRAPEGSICHCLSPPAVVVLSQTLFLWNLERPARAAAACPPVSSEKSSPAVSYRSHTPWNETECLKRHKAAWASVFFFYHYQTASTGQGTPHRSNRKLACQSGESSLSRLDGCLQTGGGREET